MNKKAIEQANDPDLRTSMAALRRAARRAREVAASTHTQLILARDGRWFRVGPVLDTTRKA